MAKIVFPLHGIRTLARWQSAFADVASRRGWRCPLEGWWFGRFSILQLFTPFARRAKVAWFRKRYTYALREHQRAISGQGEHRPSIVAHSFGTYILGYALLKYNDIRFDKIILCGSILPRSFPWAELINRGQVNAVRNDIGLQDFWAKACAWAVPGTGAAGSKGFSIEHKNLMQYEHNLKHTEFFDSAWMDENWMGFLDQSFPSVKAKKATSKAIPLPAGDRPVLAFTLSSLLSIAFLFAVSWLVWLALQHMLPRPEGPPSDAQFQIQDIERNEPIKRRFILHYTEGGASYLKEGIGSCTIGAKRDKIQISGVECSGYQYKNEDQTKLDQGFILLRRSDPRTFRLAITPFTPVDDRRVLLPTDAEYTAAVKGQEVTEATITYINGTKYHVSVLLFPWQPDGARGGNPVRWLLLPECPPGKTMNHTLFDSKPARYYFIYASVFGRTAQYLEQGFFHGPGTPTLEIQMGDSTNSKLQATLSFLER